MKLSRILLAGAAALAFVPQLAHGQSAALVQKPIATGACLKMSTGNQITDSGLGCGSNSLTVSDGLHGSMLLTPTNIVVPGAAAIINTTPQQPVLITRGVARTGTDAVDFDFRRTADYTTGGTFGFVNAVGRFYTLVTADRPSFEWPLLCVLDNNQAGTQGSQNSCGYFQAHKRYAGASTWALTAELQDHVADPTSPSVTFEHDLQAKGTDAHGARVIDDLWAKSDDGAAAQVSFGIRLNTDANTLLKTGIQLNGSYLNGINLSGGTFSSAALVLGANQHLCVDAFCAHSLFYSSGALYWNSPSGNVASISDAGQISGSAIVSGGDIYVGATSKLCLDAATCSTYLKETGGTVVHTYAGGVDALQVSAIGANATALGTTSGGMFIPSGQKYCLDGATCANYLSQSGGAITMAASGSGVTLPAATAPSLTASSGNVSVAAGSKLCLNGTACTNYMIWDSANSVIGFYIGGALQAAISSTGVVSALNNFRQGVTPVGVTCSGINAATFTANGGVVTHC